MLSVTWNRERRRADDRQVIEALQRATPETPADFSGMDLKFLDLSDLDFGRANFAGADLRSANLTGANFADADLSGADLTRAIIIRADFSGADLSNANIYRPVTFSTEDAAPSETPIFRATKFSGARLIAHLIHADLSGADFSNGEPGAASAEDVFHAGADLVVEPRRREFLRRESFGHRSSRHRISARADLSGANRDTDDRLPLRPDGRQT